MAFGILRSHWGQGYATEASVACLEMAFDTLQVGSVVATVYPENTRSITVLKKCHMAFETSVFGIWPNSLALLFRVTRETWKQRA